MYDPTFNETIWQLISDDHSIAAIGYQIMRHQWPALSYKTRLIYVDQPVVSVRRVPRWRRLLGDRAVVFDQEPADNVPLAPFSWASDNHDSRVLVCGYYAALDVLFVLRPALHIRV